MLSATRSLLLGLTLFLASCVSSGGIGSILAGGFDTVSIYGLKAPAELQDAYDRISRGEVSTSWRTAPLEERRVMAYQHFGRILTANPETTRYNDNALEILIEDSNFDHIWQTRTGMIKRLDLLDGPDGSHTREYYLERFNNSNVNRWWFNLPGDSYTPNELANAADYLLRSYPDQQISIGPLQYPTKPMPEEQGEQTVLEP